MTSTDTKCTTAQAHCENCGSTDGEDIYGGEDGYTGCCNELVAHSAASCRGHHLR